MCHHDNDNSIKNLPLDVWDCIAFFLPPSDVNAVCLAGMRALSNYLRNFHIIRRLPLLISNGHRLLPDTIGVRTLTLWTEPSMGLTMRHIRNMGRIIRRKLPLLVRIDANIGLTPESFGALKHFLRTIGRSCLGLRMFCLRLNGVKPTCNLTGVRHMSNLHHLSVVILTGNLSDRGIIQLTDGLRMLHTLQHLELQFEGNRMSDIAASILGNTLRGLTLLQSVHLSVAFNPITCVGLDAICMQRPDGWNSLHLDIQGTPEDALRQSGGLLCRAPSLRYLYLELSARQATMLAWNGWPDHPLTLRLYVHVSNVNDSLALWSLLHCIQCDGLSGAWRIVASRPCGTCLVVRTPRRGAGTIALHLASHAPMRQFLHIIHPTSLHIDLDNRRVWSDNHVIRDIPHSVACLRLRVNACTVGLAAIGTIACLPQLVDLWLQGRHNHWTSSSGLLFGNFSSCERLRILTLDLVDNCLGDVGAIGLAALAAAPHLECIVLWLGCNNISTAAAHLLWTSLARPTRTVTIHL
jgi:hypothetical protein